MLETGWWHAPDVVSSDKERKRERERKGDGKYLCSSHLLNLI